MHVAMTFEPFGDGGTRAAVEVSGFTGADALQQATDTVEGFTIVLCDLKTLLETGESPGPGARQGGAHHRGAGCAGRLSSAITDSAAIQACAGYWMDRPGASI